MNHTLSSLKAAIELRHPRVFRRLTWLRDRLAPYYAEPELRLLPALCVPGEAAYDIGANSGIYTFWLCRVAASVTAFEPNPKLAGLLESKFAPLIASGRLRVEGCALSDGDGSIVLHVPRSSALASVEAGAVGAHGEEVEAVTVPRRTLDGYDDRPVGFLKIDVEGHESAVVGGGLRLIGRDRPNLLIEAEERHNPGALAALQARLAPLGYRGYFVLAGRLCTLDGFDPDRHQSRSALNAAGTHRIKGRIYINNFIFVARDGVADRLRAALGQSSGS
ncbi:FkbM family methyltransferase [Azospirillum brasilense]|uniref:FkbM family methyltransferase n=1 Tax=Azospirillum brasilense TaxID=192 RepID=A0A560CDJ7_AZOBR|nr:FkbM family methyltransferase [Azospirillum brasilense]MBK3733731.1 FkbM family methyltransferase [Azospirillum brasilense]TWA82929.1 FkbM family methyltransferase [Azospirillum brasilense]